MIKGLAVTARSILPEVRIPAPNKGEMFAEQMPGAKNALPG